jgi:hypothetical protein
LISAASLFQDNRPDPCSLVDISCNLRGGRHPTLKPEAPLLIYNPKIKSYMVRHGPADPGGERIMYRAHVALRETNNKPSTSSPRAPPTPYHFVLSRLPRFFNPGGRASRNGDNESDFRCVVEWDGFSSFRLLGTAFCIAPRRACPHPRRFSVVRVEEASASSDSTGPVSDDPWLSYGGPPPSSAH